MFRIAFFPFLVLLLTVTPQQDPPNADKENQDKTSETQPAEKQTRQRNPVQARVFEELLRENERTRGKPIISEDDGQASAEEVGEGKGLLNEGAILVNRLGRLVSAKGRVEFHYSPGAEIKDAPAIMTFNKNKLLELMEKEADAGVQEFIITAEVTRYRGQNYLNLLKYRRQISHGNLNP